MSSAEIARRSGLSAQTVSNIARALEADGLLVRGPAIRGKVGKPSVPIELNPSGAYSLGISIGRRSAELVLVDFSGSQIDAERIAYPYPVIETVFGFLRESFQTLLRRNGTDRTRIAGIGVARPNRLWDWLEVANAPETAMKKWQLLDLEQAVQDATDCDVFIENDATSACLAEHLLGRGPEFSDFAYIFVGSFVGGGLVLKGKVVSGQTLNAAALGPMPVADERGQTVQLLSVASLYTLEQALEKSHGQGRVLQDDEHDWDGFEGVLGPWIQTTAEKLAWACASIASVVEVECVLLDGAMPPHVCERLTAETAEAFKRLDTTGIEMLRIERASVGRHARSLGAALLPIHARYFLA